VTTQLSDINVYFLRKIYCYWKKIIRLQINSQTSSIDEDLRKSSRNRISLCSCKDRNYIGEMKRVAFFNERERLEVNRGNQPTTTKSSGIRQGFNWIKWRASTPESRLLMRLSAYFSHQQPWKVMSTFFHFPPSDSSHLCTCVLYM